MNQPQPRLPPRLLRDPVHLLALGLGLFHGFSKMLIALGLEPDEMDDTVLPTPAPLGNGADVGGGSQDRRPNFLARGRSHGVL